MARLQFSTQLSRKIDTRTKPTKYNQSTLRNIMRDLGQGDSLSSVFYPYKYLPAQLQDVTTEDFIVIPKGRIVSLLTHYDTTEVSGIITPSGAGSIEIGLNKTDSDVAVTALIDDTFYGYPNSVAGLLVPANGGLLASGQWSTRDVTAETIKGVTALAAAPNIQPNYPIGVVPGDVYQDIRGKFLNYQMWDKSVAVVTDWYVEVPFVKVPNSTSGTYTADPSTPEEVGTTMTFGTINSKYTYMTLYSDDVYKTGMPVMSDIRGNYKMQGKSAAEGGITTIYNFNPQTVGRLVLIDCRFPKDQLEIVDTLEGSDMPGTDTGGIPSYIYNFAHDTCVALSRTHTIKQLVANIQGGQFGGARVLINI
jgi:hypothetical protein